jgi:hypothetical protein
MGIGITRNCRVVEVVSDDDDGKSETSETNASGEWRVFTQGFIRSLEERKRLGELDQRGSIEK